MEDFSRTILHDLHLASRKAEEATWRRFQAAEWLESLVGPLGISKQPSEQEFISCLRNGLVLCNAINKIQPGSVSKVVDSHSLSVSWESQPLPAYQYFENVRNFLVALEELKLPAFEASDLERDTLEAGCTTKVVDCILTLKSFHEQSGNGFYKHAKSPMTLHSGSRTHSQVFAANSSDTCRRLDLSASSKKQPPKKTENQKLEDSLFGALVEFMLDKKENIDQNCLASFRHGHQDFVKLFGNIMASCLQEQQLNKFPELKSILEESSVGANSSFAHSTSSPVENLSAVSNNKCCKSCLKNGSCQHWPLLEVQEKYLMELKALLSMTKKDFEVLQSQLQSDLVQLGRQVQELSTAALGYQRMVKENRNLYNMVQDLKGNIRVYCRIRPALYTETKSAIDFIGEDGSLVIIDPLKPNKVARKVFRFNQVFGPSATQEEVFKDMQPLIRSVMDGYNVCILAYGQTGSGKTYTMSGPSGGSAKDKGINYLALNDLFQISCSRKDEVKYEVRVQMVEIYNEQVRDLLAEDSSTTKLEIRTCTSYSGLSLPDATMHPVKSPVDVLNLMELGEMNRVVSSTAINNRSSRSHSVLTVHVQGKDTSGSILRSCLHLVDLAGSERVDKSEVTGDRLKEALHINKSLSCLGDVIAALAQKNSHIPYRNSKLTQLLQDSLGGHGKTLMFAHVSPEGDSYGETVSTLKFAQRASTVELGAARLNKENTEVKELREQVESLKKALASKEAHMVQNEKAMRSPCVKPKLMSERTPPRPRRLSIESSSVIKTEKVMNPDDRKGSKTPVVKAKVRKENTPTRSQRLSLEGPKYGKDDQVQLEKIDVDLNCINAVAVQQYNASLQDVWIDRSVCGNAESITSSGNYSNLSSMTELHHHGAPRSPSSCQNRPVGTHSRTRIPTVLLKTPEPLILARDKVQIVPHNELDRPNKSQAHSLSDTKSKKGSQFRKSLQTIGKLINDSQRRNKQHPNQINCSTHGVSNITDEMSQITANARALRRQSLTGFHTRSDGSRRSSLGGKSTDSYSNENRNARTPPPLYPSADLTKRWL